MTVTMTRAVIYARYSSDQQDDATIETQLRECHHKAAALGAIVVHEYCDLAQSGRSDDRQQFRQMLQDAKHKGFQIVIVRKLDRFARNVVDAGLTEQHLAKYGARLVSCHESFDDSTTAGWFSKQMVHLVNEWYSRNLATETISGMETNTRKGFRCGGSAPYGYKNVKTADQTTGKIRTRLEIDDHESEAVKLIFQRYSQGVGFDRIIAELVQKGYPPRRSKTWLKSQLSQMLENETYTGVLIWRKTPDPSTWVRAENAVPALIDADLWNVVVARKTQLSRTPSRSKGASAHPLAGIAKCAECGAAYVIHSKQGEKWRLHCSGRVRKTGCVNQRSVFENYLVDEIKTALVKNIFTDENIRLALDQLKKELGTCHGEQELNLRKIRAKITEIEEKQVCLVSEMAGGALPREVVLRTIQKTEEEKSGLLARAKEIEVEMHRASGLKITEEDVSEFAALARCSLDTDDYQSLKSHFQRFKVSVLIGRNEAKIQIAPDIFGSDIVLLGAGDGISGKTICFLKQTIKLGSGRNNTTPRDGRVYHA